MPFDTSDADRLVSALDAVLDPLRGKRHETILLHGITGSSGSTDQGSLVTVSGGARG